MGGWGGGKVSLLKKTKTVETITEFGRNGTCIGFNGNGHGFLLVTLLVKTNKFKLNMSQNHF